jgi:hypothetical protein
LTNKINQNNFHNQNLKLLYKSSNKLSESTSNIINDNKLSSTYNNKYKSQINIDIDTSYKNSDQLINSTNIHNFLHNRHNYIYDKFSNNK